MSRSYVYENGLPFTDGLKRNLDAQIERVHVRGLASVIIIDGTPGTGKTTLARHIGQYIADKCGAPKFDNEKQIDIGGEKFLEKARYCAENKLPVLVFDEGFAFSRRKSLTKFNQDLNEFFQEFRTFKIIVVLCLPDYNHLDRWLYSIRVVRLLIQLTHKHMPNNRSAGYVDFKGYGPKRIFDVLLLRDKLKLPYASSRVTPNFQGHFKPLPPEEQAALDASSTAGKKRRLDKKSRGDLITAEDMAKALKVSIQRTRVLIKQNYLNPVDLQGRTQLYNPEDLTKIKKNLSKVGEKLK